MHESILGEYPRYHGEGVISHSADHLSGPNGGAGPDVRHRGKSHSRNLPEPPADSRFPDLRDLINHKCSIQGSETLSSTFSQINLTPHDFMAVLDGDRLLGICSRRKIGMILGSSFGRELFGKKPVREHLEPNCLTVVEGAPIVEVLSTVSSVEDQYYFNDIILLDCLGFYVGLISVLTMIRLQHRILQALNLEQEQYFKLFNSSSDMMCIVDQNGCFKKVNPACTEMLGYAEPELLGHQLLEFVHSDDLQKTSDELERLRRCGSGSSVENRYLQKDGTICWVSWQLFYARGEGLTYATGRDINARKQHERELEETREAAEAANRAKSEFLSNMSHEIRTPMNAVLGLAQLLEKGELSPDQRDMVQKIRGAGHSLLGILNDILDLSKIEAGRLRIEMHPFTLSALLTQLDSLMGSAARSKGLDLRIEAPTEVTGALVGDDLRLGQILINLVGNAVKFTEQGEIRILIQPVELTEASVKLRFEVRDTGVGIAPEVLATLFTPFTQADDSITRRFGGTGLGLSISKRLAELMGGKIGVGSEEGVGSTFWFEIPFERTTVVAVTPGAAAHIVPDGPRLKGQRVLVVDDSELNRIVVVRALALEGADSETACDGQQALDRLRERPREFDVVLMDVQMPVMDGLTATQELRRDPVLARIPVIAFTAGVLQEERRKASDAGVNDFLPKPVDLEEMVAVLLRWTTPRVGGGAPTLLPEPRPGKKGTLLPEKLPGLDIAKGVALCGGEKFYREMIGELVRCHGDDVAGIKAALAAGNPHQAARTAHTLKGVAGNLSAVTVHRIADRLEAALKHDEWDLADRTLLRLTEAMEELHASALLLKEEPTILGQGDTVPLPPPGELSPLLDELLLLLQERRMAARKVMGKLVERLSRTVVAPEVELLSGAVDRLEFVAAQTMVRHLTCRFNELAERTP